jgi:hypothetical protein
VTNATTPFLRPPLLLNESGEVRRAGFEFELAGLTLFRAAALVRQVFPGDHVVRSTWVHRVESAHGPFELLLDTRVLKDKTYVGPLKAVGLDVTRMESHWLEGKVLDALPAMIPIEISTPPIPMDRLQPLDQLRRCLHDAGAKGTRASLFYAFGLHINPELPRHDPGSILAHLRAFLLLAPHLYEAGQTDATRRFSPYIRAFPTAYVGRVLSPLYPDNDLGRLIDDYLEFNPTRNRPLDLLPALAYLDEGRVMRAARERHLIKGRPAFHYRLPNCLIDEPGWTLAGEWNRWLLVERLAADTDLLFEASADYRRDASPWLARLRSRYVPALEEQAQPMPNLSA